RRSMRTKAGWWCASDCLSQIRPDDVIERVLCGGRTQPDSLFPLPVSPDEACAEDGPGDAEGVEQRLVVAGRDAVDEAELDWHRHDRKTAAAGADDHLALHVEAVGVQL